MYHTYITQLILGISDNPVIILLIMNVLLLVVGTFMDLTPASINIHTNIPTNSSKLRYGYNTIWYNVSI